MILGTSATWWSCIFFFFFFFFYFFLNIKIIEFHRIIRLSEDIWVLFSPVFQYFFLFYCTSSVVGVHFHYLSLGLLNILLICYTGFTLLWWFSLIYLLKITEEDKAIIQFSYLIFPKNLNKARVPLQRKMIKIKSRYDFLRGLEQYMHSFLLILASCGNTE